MSRLGLRYLNEAQRREEQSLGSLASSMYRLVRLSESGSSSHDGREAKIPESYKKSLEAYRAIKNKER